MITYLGIAYFHQKKEKIYLMVNGNTKQKEEMEMIVTKVCSATRILWNQGPDSI